MFGCSSTICVRTVEIRDDPSLIGRPVVVGGSPKGRGVIAAASCAAGKSGIHSAMASATANRLCPDIVFIKSRMQHYAAISKQIRENRQHNYLLNRAGVSTVGTPASP